MTIDASGNVGIGTVPSNWIDQSTALEIGPSMALEDYSVGGANASVIYNNAYRNASNVIVYKETDFASTYGQYNGEHIFNVAPSGTAGATISLTQALKMTQSEVVANGLGVDRDFRVESVNSQYALFVDAANNSVGIKTNATDAALNVNSQSGTIDAIRIQGSGGNNFIAGYGNQGNLSFTLQEGEGDDASTLILYRLGNAQHIIDADSNENVIFNEQGDNIDFRVESDANANALFVDASTNRVGILTASPSEALHVTGRSRINSLYLGEVSGSTDIVQGTSGNLYLTGSGSNITLGSSEAIFNEAGANIDFRVESDANTHMVFVNGGNNQVNIGTSSTIGGMLNIAGSLRTMNTSNKVISSLRPSGWGYSQGAYGVTVLGDGTTGGTVSIGYDPSGNPSGAFTGYGQEMLFRSDMSFLQPNSANNGYMPQIRMESSTGVIINENGNDLDFRVESNTKNEMLYVDAGNDVVNINSTQTTHQMGGGYRTDGLLKDFKRDEAVATFNESATSGTTSRTRRLIIPLYNYGPVRITIMNGGHLYNNGAAFGFRETTFYIAMESSSLRVNTKVDGVNAGTYASSYGVPTATAHSSLPELKIEFTVAAQMTCSTHVRVEGYGANGIKSIETL